MMEDRSWNTKLLVILTLIVLFSGLGFLWFGKPPSEVLPTSTPDIVEQTSEATSSGILVTEVVDGDTINLEDGTTVRLIGIDTPETKDPRRPVGCFGKEASSETKNLIEGKRVILEKDISETDKYSRLLRYVYLPLDSGKLLFVNDYLVREGFAKVYTYPPDIKYNEQLLEAEKQAREGSRGLWGRCGKLELK